jgi:TP901 family phage tail tape measure protein
VSSFKNINVVLTGNSANLSAVLRSAARDIERFGTQINSTGASASTFTNVAKGLGVAGLAIAAGLSYAAKEAAAFERQMRNVNSIAKLSEGGLKAMSKEVLALSRTLPQSATTLAAGLYDIVSSGFQGADALNILKVSAKAASAGLTTTAVSAKGINAVLNAYGLSAKDAADVSDVLFQTVNLGVVTFEELSGSIGDVVGTAAAAGVSIDQVGSAIATMTLSGISAAESTTALNRVLQSFIKPSDALAAKMAELHIRLSDLKDPSIGLTGVMAKLGTATHGNIEEISALFPEIRSLKGALALMSAEGRTYARVAADITDKNVRAGATQAAFAEQMKSASAQWTLFRNNVDAAAIVIGTKLLPTLVLVMKWAQDFASTAAPYVQQAFAMLIPVFQNLHQAGINIVDLFHNLEDSLGPVAGALAAVGWGALVVTLQLFSAALREVTQFLAEHKTVATTLAIILAGRYVSSVLLAAAANNTFKNSLLGNALSSAIMWVRQLVGGFAALAAVNGGGALGAIKAGAQGLGSALASPAAAGAFLIGALKTQIDMWNNAKKAGEDYAKAVVDNINPNRFSSTVNAVDELRTKMDELQKAHAGQRNSIGELARGWADVVIPFQNMGNTIVDNKRAMDGINPTLEQLQTRMAKIKIIAADMGVGFKFSEDAVLKFAKTLNLDIDKMPYQQVTAAIRDAYLAAQAGSPQLEALAGSFATAGDDTASATDKLKAYKTAMDAVIGVVLSAFDAETSWAQSLRDVDSAVRTNGGTLDEFTDKGQKNRKAFSDAAKAALDHSQAVAEESGSIAKGNQTLAAHVESLKGVMKQAGMSDQAIADLITQMGLTPENLATLVKLDGTEEAKKALEETKKRLEEVGKTNVTAKINADTSGAMANMSALEAKVRSVIATGDASSFFAINTNVTPAERQASRNVFGGKRARGGGVGGGMDYLVGERGPEVVRFSGTGYVYPHGSPVTQNHLKGFAAGGPISEAQRVAAGRSAAQDGSQATKEETKDQKDAAKAAKDHTEELKKLNEEIAKNHQQWDLDHASLRDRIAMLDGLIAKERPFTDEWTALAHQREDAAKELAQNEKDKAKEVKDYLQAIFDKRVEDAKNAYEETGKGEQAYIDLLKEKHAQLERDQGYWSDDARAVRDELVGLNQAHLDEERRIEDARYKLGEQTTAQRLETLQRRLAAEKAYTQEWVDIQTEINSILADQAAKQKQAMEQIVNSVADVYLNAKRAFNQQQEAYKQAIDSARSQVVGDLSNVYESARKRFEDQAAEYQKTIEDRSKKITDGIVGVFGNAPKVSARALTTYLSQQVKAAQMWQDEMAKIQTSGLDSTLIARLRAAGPPALGLAKALNSLDPKVVNDAMAQLGQIEGSTDRLFLDPQTTMKSFNDLLAEETTKWQGVNADRAEAKAWAESMAGAYMPQVNFQWKTFDQLLEEEAAAQRDAMAGRTEAEDWAGRMIGQVGTLNGALRDMIALLQQAAQKQLADSQPTYSAQPITTAAFPPGTRVVDANGTVRGWDGSTISVADGVKAGWYSPGPNGTVIIPPGDMAQVISGNVRSYDQGGYLPTGWTMAYNGTGRPEPVGHHLAPTINMGGISITGATGDPWAMRKAVEAGVGDALGKVVGRLQQGVRR